jgi:aromatic ring hydroxylase
MRGINTVRVITSNDADAITVNGIEAKKTDDSKIIKSMVKMLDKLYGNKHNADDYCVWTVEVKSAPVYDIVAFQIVEIPDPSIDASAVFEPETVAHTVISNINGTNTVRVITSKDVSSIIVNGVKAEKINDAKILKSMVKMLDKLYDDKHNESDYYVWTVDVKSAASYDIVAFNEYGVSTIPAIENTKNVSNK